MEITDEIIGCFIEGTATPDERICVREYLYAHPEEYEHFISLLDDDTSDFIPAQGEGDDEYLFETEGAFSDMDCSEAAFQPMLCMAVQPGTRNNQKGKISDRLRKLWDELDM